MASILDKFVIQIGLDGAKLKKGTADAKKDLDGLQEKGKETGDQLVDAGKKMGSAFSAARNEALALLAVFTGGRSLKAFTSEITKANAQLGYTSQRLSVRPQNLSTLQNMLKMIGGNADDAASSINSLQQRMLDPQQSGNLSNIFSQLGISNWRELSKDPTGLFRALNSSTQGLNQQKKNALLGQLGISGSAVDLIDQSKQEFGSDEARARSITQTDKQIEQSQQLQKDWNTLKLTTESLGNSMLSHLVPGLDAIVKEFIEIEHANPKVIESIGLLAGAFIGLGTAVKGLLVLRGISSLLHLGGSTPSLSRIIPGVTRTIAGTVGPHLLRALPAMETVGSGLLRTVPVVGTAAALAYSPSVNTGEGARVDRLRQKGAFGPHPFGNGPFQKYADAVARIEGARYDQMGGFNRAYAGKYQFSRDAIEDAAKFLHEKIPSTAEFLNNPAMQERYFRANTERNFKTLFSKSPLFRNANEYQRLAILGYAHNQGAGGTLNWLNTGTVGKDGFGTSGTRYSDSISRALSSYSNAAGTNTGTSSVVNLHGDVNIKTNATDASGIAREIRNSLTNPSSLSHGNARGLQ